jgi:phosphomannomutase
MALIASISGIRGTLGGRPTTALTPLDVVKFTTAYSAWLAQRSPNRTVVIGRDARPSGIMVRNLVASTLNSMGFNVVDLGLTTTPTVELAVTAENAAGGIVLTASHNPVEWNALKLLNERGEFISAEDGAAILDAYNAEEFQYVTVSEIGATTESSRYLEYHIQSVLALPLVDVEAIRAANLRVVVDAVNSSGGIYVPALLRALGVSQVVELNCEPTGHFAHNPEPLKEHLGQICEFIRTHGADVGIVVDPDVDRLALITEEGEMFGEEYTLVAVADYVLANTPGAAVSNLSSSRALRDVCTRHQQPYSAAAVGEVNVVAEMKRVGAVIGGEGNGGIIYPESHYGRDALVGIGLFLSHLVKSGKKMSALRAHYPHYAMAKHKIELTPSLNVDRLLSLVADRYSALKPNTIDGVKIDFENAWVHLRKSNTEPIIRIYTEAPSQHEADELAKRLGAELLADAAVLLGSH